MIDFEPLIHTFVVIYAQLLSRHGILEFLVLKIIVLQIILIVANRVFHLLQSLLSICHELLLLALVFHGFG